MRWPLVLSALLVLLNLVLFAVDVKAALIMLLFSGIFVAASLVLYFYSRKALYTGMVGFAQGFSSTESQMLDDMSSAAAIWPAR